MTDHVLSGLGAPTSAPPMIGAHYTDTLNGDQYLAKGTLGADDWMKVPSAPVMDGVTLSATGSTTVTPESDGAFLNVEAASAAVVTIEAGAWSSRSRLEVARGGAGAVTFKAGAGVTLNTAASRGLKIGETHGVARLKHLGDNVWNVYGELAAYAPPNLIAAALGSAPYIEIHDYDTLERVTLPFTLTYSGYAVGVAVSPDGALLAVSDSNGSRVYSTRDWSQVSPPAFTDNAGWTAGVMRFSPDSKSLVLLMPDASASPLIRVFDTDTWAAHTLDYTGSDVQADVEFSADGSRMVVVGRGGSGTRLTVFDTATWTKVTAITPSLASNATCAAFSPDGSTLAVGLDTSAESVQIYSATDGALLQAVATSARGYGPKDMAWSPDGATLMVGWADTSSGSKLAMFNTADWSALTNSLTSFGLSVYAVRFTPDSSRLLLGTSGATPIRMYATNDWSSIALPNLTANANPRQITLAIAAE